MVPVWLAGVLAVAAAGLNRMEAPAAPACVIDAAEDDVMTMLGRPDKQAFGCRNGETVSFWLWQRVDWLGGRHERVVVFLDGIADTDTARYQAFAETPPWLAALRDALAPLSRSPHRPPT